VGWVQVDVALWRAHVTQGAPPQSSRGSSSAGELQEGRSRVEERGAWQQQGGRVCSSCRCGWLPGGAAWPESLAAGGRLVESGGDQQEVAGGPQAVGKLGWRSSCVRGSSRWC
jgi:hypothetical protein